MAEKKLFDNYYTLKSNILSKKLSPLFTNKTLSEVFITMWNSCQGDGNRNDKKLNSTMLSNILEDSKKEKENFYNQLKASFGAKLTKDKNRENIYSTLEFLQKFDKEFVNTKVHTKILAKKEDRFDTYTSEELIQFGISSFLEENWKFKLDINKLGEESNKVIEEIFKGEQESFTAKNFNTAYVKIFNLAKKFGLLYDWGEETNSIFKKYFKFDISNVQNIFYPTPLFFASFIENDFLRENLSDYMGVSYKLDRTSNFIGNEKLDSEEEQNKYQSDVAQRKFNSDLRINLASGRINNFVDNITISRQTAYRAFKTVDDIVAINYENASTNTKFKPNSKNSSLTIFNAFNYSESDEQFFEVLQQYDLFKLFTDDFLDELELESKKSNKKIEKLTSRYNKLINIYNFICDYSSLEFFIKKINNLKYKDKCLKDLEDLKTTKYLMSAKNWGVKENSEDYKDFLSYYETGKPYEEPEEGTKPEPIKTASSDIEKPDKEKPKKSQEETIEDMKSSALEMTPEDFGRKYLKNKKLYDIQDFNFGKVIKNLTSYSEDLEDALKGIGEEDQRKFEINQAEDRLERLNNIIDFLSELSVIIAEYKNLSQNLNIKEYKNLEVKKEKFELKYGYELTDKNLPEFRNEKGEYDTDLQQLKNLYPKNFGDDNQVESYVKKIKELKNKYITEKDYVWQLNNRLQDFHKKYKQYLDKFKENEFKNDLKELNDLKPQRLSDEEQVEKYDEKMAELRRKYIPYEEFSSILKKYRDKFLTDYKNFLATATNNVKESLEKYIESFSSEEQRNYLRKLLLESDSSNSLDKILEDLEIECKEKHFKFEKEPKVLTDEEIDSAFLISAEPSITEADDPETGKRMQTKTIQQVKTIDTDGNVATLPRISSEEENKKILANLKKTTEIMLKILTITSQDPEIDNSVTVIIYKKG